MLLFRMHFSEKKKKKKDLWLFALFWLVVFLWVVIF